MLSPTPRAGDVVPAQHEDVLLSASFLAYSETASETAGCAQVGGVRVRVVPGLVLGVEVEMDVGGGVRVRVRGVAC